MQTFARIGLLSLALVLFGSSIGACDEASGDVQDDAPYTDHAEVSDLTWSGDGKADGFGAGRAFDANHILSDTLFTDPDGLITAEMIQAFFESENPYGLRSWLADEMLGDESAAAG